MLGRKIVSLVMATVLVTTLSCQVTPADQADGTGKTYYVSSSQGKDSNTGTSIDKPWKSLSKISAQKFKPGDKILLKCGDTWTGEALKLNGNGDADKFILLSFYGEGAKPVIKNPVPDQDTDLAYNRGEDARTSIKVAVKIKNAVNWKIAGIEISNAEYGLIAYNNTQSIYSKIWIEDCYIHDIAGGRLLKPGDNPYPLLIKSDGIFIYGYSPVVKDCKIERSSRAMGIINCVNMLVDGLYAYDSYTEGIHLHTVYGGTLRNSKILHTGYPEGVWHGVAGIFIGQCYDLILRDSEVGDVYDHGPDGVGIDYEGLNSNITTQNCYIHDCYSSAFLIFDVGGKKADNEISRIVNCTIEDNGLKDPAAIPAFLRHYSNIRSGGVISGNHIKRASKAQKINEIFTFKGNLTDDYPMGYATADNKAFGPDESFPEWVSKSKESEVDFTTAKWTASEGFTPAQGNNQWYYVQRGTESKRIDGSKYTYLKWIASKNTWVDNSSKVEMGADWQVPDKEFDSIRRWFAPITCRVSVKGSVKKVQKGGDGVSVSVQKNGVELFGRAVKESDVVFGPKDLDGSNTGTIIISAEVDVEAGDFLDFIVSTKGSPDHDKVQWNPQISVLKIYDEKNPMPKKPVKQKEENNAAVPAEDPTAGLAEGTYWLASKGFSGIQGKNGWSYQQWDGKKYSDMSYDKQSNFWKGSANFVITADGWQHPDNGFDSVRKWVAPKAGKITIKGIAKKASAGGDGVMLSIKKNSSTLLGPTHLKGDNTNGVKMETSTEVKQGDAIYFIVNMNKEVNYDATLWDPVIIIK